MTRTFLEQLSRPRPDPGGGAAAAHAAAIGVALLEKVVGLELQRNDNALQDFWNGEMEQARRLSSVLAEIQDKDCEAYLRLAQAKASGCPYQELEPAIKEAVARPSEIIETAGVALASVSRAGSGCKAHLAADLQVACELLAAAIMGAYHIATANLSLFKNESEQARTHLLLSTQLDGALQQLEAVRQELLVKIRARFGRI